ncbi:MAG: tetratricopeptide repeat protein [Planctomycetes bacterium]|nr:tetratricopeptide repeat protein [Planctomycetota bacterium]
MTFSEHVAPIVFKSCAPCHRSGESAPFELLAYQDVKKRARQIAVVTKSRYMPPWLPASGHGEFLGTRALSDEEVAVIGTWVESGAPEGDPARLPPRPQWTSGWQLGEPDLVITMPDPYTLPAEAPEGQDMWRNFVLPIPNSSTRFVEAVEFRPGNARVVHHAIMQIDTTSSSRIEDAKDAETGFPGMRMARSQPPSGHFVGWTPGKVPARAPEGMSWRLDRGSDLVLQLHMLPTGKPEPLQCSIGFYFASRPPSRHPVVVMMTSDSIDIPAGERDHVVEDFLVLPVDTQALVVYPHAHYLGKKMEVYGDRPDGTRESLLLIEDWDFNWQDEYHYREPPVLPKGTRLTMRFTFDNSAKNPRNPNVPPRRVRYGNQSTDEMADLILQLLPQSAEHALEVKEAICRRAVERRAKFSSLSDLGAILAIRGKHEEAIQQFRKGLEIAPKSVGLHVNLGGSLAALRKLPEAIEHLEEALSIAPSDTDAHLNLAAVRTMQGKWEDAANLYHEILKTNPYCLQAHQDLGTAMLQLRRPQYATLSFRKAIALDPLDFGSHYQLGIIAFSSRQFEAATDSFLSVVKIQPKHYKAHQMLAAIYETNGERESVARHLELAIRYAPLQPKVNFMAQLAVFHAVNPKCTADEAVRAVWLAEQATRATGRKDVAVLDALAISYAAAGEFVRATGAAEEALRIALTQRDRKRVADIQKRLVLYRSGRPFRISQR